MSRIKIKVPVYVSLKYPNPWNSAFLRVKNLVLTIQKQLIEDQKEIDKIIFLLPNLNIEELTKEEMKNYKKEKKAKEE